VKYFFHLEQTGTSSKGPSPAVEDSSLRVLAMFVSDAIVDLGVSGVPNFLYTVIHMSNVLMIPEISEFL